MNNTIDFNTAKTIGTMSKKIDHIDDTVSSFFSFMHMVIKAVGFFHTEHSPHRYGGNDYEP